MIDNTINNILQKRAKLHGDFADNARVCMDFIHTVMNEPKFHTMTLEQQYSIIMILGKISRAVNGNNNDPDHWDDIQGYAELAKKSIPTNTPK